MDKTCVQVPPVLRKEKKKHVKDELDRLKQAEKKKRRLEKALATSAAIRSELEKKKQKKKEEQQRLDEEGAAIAEAVALQVLCDDSEESCQILLNKDQGYKLNMLEHANAGFFVEGMQTLPAYQGFAKYPVEGISWVSEAYGSGCKWRDCGIGWFNPHGMLGMDFRAPYFIERGLSAEVSDDGLIAAHAVSSLQIADDIGNKANLRYEV